MRVMVNTVFGMGGLGLDPASEMGLLSPRRLQPDLGCLGRACWCLPGAAGAGSVHLAGCRGADAQHEGLAQRALAARGDPEQHHGAAPDERAGQPAGRQPPVPGCRPGPYLFTRDAYLQRQASLLEVQDDEEIGKPPSMETRRPRRPAPPSGGDVSTGTRP